jgi:hypothetical protein
MMVPAAARLFRLRTSLFDEEAVLIYVFRYQVLFSVGTKRVYLRPP